MIKATRFLPELEVRTFQFLFAPHLRPKLLADSHLQIT